MQIHRLSGEKGLFIGSVSFHYADVIKEVAKEYGVEVGEIYKSPMDGLVKYHCLENEPLN